MPLKRRQPIDWNRGAGRPRQQRPDGVDIIVPVYGAPECVQRCLESVAAHSDLSRHRLIVVVDGPQDTAVEAVLASFHLTELLRNESRSGFVRSVNRGMRASARDVILLNSDTVVTPRWIEKLMDAASSCGDVGTVTPLSNNATLCSVPRAFEQNLLPVGHDANSFAAVVEKVSHREYPRLPTGVGVCLYIRRTLIDDIGLFDAERFGLGYGEENDFCLRALARGWLHVADDATFIEHTGHGSFGDSRRRLQRRAARLLHASHPAYVATIAHFMRQDPLEAVRGRIASALRPPRTKSRMPERVLHVVHGWPPLQQAGTELYAWWLVQRQLQWRDVSVYTRLDAPGRRQGEAVERLDFGARVRLVTNNFTQRDPLARNAIRDASLEEDFDRFLQQERPAIVHIHHLAGHAFSLATVAHRRGIPIVQQIHDWWPLCARVNLYDKQGGRCSGPAPGKCARCAPLTRVPPAGAWNRALHLLRAKAVRRSMSCASAYVMGSHFIRADFEHFGLLSSGTPAFVLPYGVAVQQQPWVRRGDGSLRFGFIGSIMPHKGLHLAVEAFRGIDPAEATLHAWGNPAISPDYTAMLRDRGAASFTLEGTLAEEQKAMVFGMLDALIVPSIGVESFGLAAREALMCGVPVLAAADGALTELFAAGTAAGGSLFPAGDSEALGQLVRRIIACPQLLDQWRAAITSPKGADEHAEEIETVYEHVLRNVP